MSARSLLNRHPVAAFFVLAYLITWAGVLAVGGPKFFRGEALGMEDALRMGPIMLAGPFISGLAMTLIADGWSGIGDIFSRMLRWRVGLQWYAAALLIFPSLILIVLLSLSSTVSSAFMPGFVAFGFTGGLLAGFIEETGWMGYAYPRMEARWGVWRATIYLALLHGLWHAAADFLGSSGAYGVYWLPRFILMWFIAMSAMRVLLVWIYRNTGSLFLAQLTHASSTGALIMMDPQGIAPEYTTLWYGIYAAVLWIPALVVIAIFGTTLGGVPDTSKDK